MKTTEHCGGCENDFYNDRNPYGVKRCWHLDNAELVKRLRIPISLAPPYKHIKPIKVLNCRTEKGYVLVKQESIAADGYWQR